jgi:hypothetical protein
VKNLSNLTKKNKDRNGFLTYLHRKGRKLNVKNAKNRLWAMMKLKIVCNADRTSTQVALARKTGRAMLSRSWKSCVYSAINKPLKNLRIKRWTNTSCVAPLPPHKDTQSQHFYFRNSLRIGINK